MAARAEYDGELMPLPKPNPGESRDDFVSRCMADETMRSEFPDESQRAAVCNRQALSSDIPGADMNLSTPVEVKVLRRRENGSGVVEIPLLPASTIDMEFTHGPGSGEVEITVADLQQIVANFPHFPGPVPVSSSPHENDRSGVAAGFVNAVSVRGSVLFGEVDLTPELFREVAADGWRGFSVEIARDLKTATVELQGWALTGGVFTNRPATDVNFRIAAEAVESSSYLINHISLRAKETKMADEKMAALEAELKTANGQLETQKQVVETLRGQAEKTGGDTVELETKLTEVNKDLTATNIALSTAKAEKAGLEGTVGELTKKLATEVQARKASEVKLEAEQNRTLKDEVIALAQFAIDRGVSATLFEDLEADPVAWFNSRYASIEAMQQFVEALPTVKESAVRSGPTPDKTATVSAETATKLRRQGLGTDFAGVSNIDEMRELREKKAQEK